MNIESRKRELFRSFSSAASFLCRNVLFPELIEIPLEDWKHVDYLEDYPRLYDRKLIQATLTDGITDTGWGYIMNSLPANAKVIQSGNWKKL